MSEPSETAKEWARRQTAVPPWSNPAAVERDAAEQTLLAMCYDAGAAAERAAAAEREKLHVKALALVNAQAEDEALWFDPVTATEAYLQRQLRLLHATIEGDHIALAAIREAGMVKP